MQQGRVTLDANLNEQVDITIHRVETETLDTIGPTGVPMHTGGFHLLAQAADLSSEEQAQPGNQNPPALDGDDDFLISAGRMYVDGILAVNEQICSFKHQPDPPAMEPVTNGTYLAYCDIWQRHITALDDPQIRETALGGPDTANREKTVWQVKLERLGDTSLSVHCLSELAEWDTITAETTGRMAARAEPGSVSTNPCSINPGAGYRRLENQLYRIEVHLGGPRGTATFKWSRDNGSIVTRWESQSGDDITVASAGMDVIQRFASGMWIELTDEDRELQNMPGTLVQIASVNDLVLTLNPATADGPVDITFFGANAKVRRWDSQGTIRPTNNNWLDIEDGIQARFSTGSYKSGDCWMIPARTVGGTIEWPEESGSSTPLQMLPMVETHHFSRLAIMRFDGSVWTVLEDCRLLFPPITELKNFFYAGGDGQDDLPGAILDRPLQVGVSNGVWPIENARVRFRRITPDGALLAGSGTEESGSATERIVLTNSEGIAECGLQLGGPTATVTHVVEARLIDIADEPLHLPVMFNAAINLASELYYEAQGCPALSEADTVQDALTVMNRMVSLVKCFGDGQQTSPGDPLEKLLCVAATSDCGPVAGALVRFTPEAAGVVAASHGDLPGAVPGPVEMTSDPGGLITLAWQPDPNPTLAVQELEAVLLEADGRQLKHPTTVRFTTTFSHDTRCPRFLDELRSDGVIRNEENVLGLEVTRTEESDQVAYSSGVAYVGGCRFEIEAGTLTIDMFTSPNTILVDDQGMVRAVGKGLPRPCALLASVYPYQTAIISIVDKRLDLTHLDEKVRINRREIAARRSDRRRFIPLLAQTLPDVTFRDGKNYAVNMPYPMGLAFDGNRIWTASFSESVYSVDPNLHSGDTYQSAATETITNSAAFDGYNHVWFTSPLRQSGDSFGINNEVLLVDIRSYEVTRLTSGSYPLNLASNGSWMWVTNFESRTISVFDATSQRQFMTLTLIGPNGEPVQPTGIAYDGTHMWVGANPGALYKIDFTGSYERIELDTNQAIYSVAFDGSHVWATRGMPDAISNQVYQVDVVTNQVNRIEIESAQFLMCDGKDMWIYGNNQANQGMVYAYDATTAVVQAHFNVGIQLLGPAAFDGTHSWWSYLNRNTWQSGIRRMLVS
ncbi:MAG: hypothetical protein GY703_12150 [Gammaproteobacteria bacterium]|nr:hypothetical protein [Gammaproteobacteria bacterium]